MPIDNRDVHEARLTRIVSKLTASQRERLIAAMGAPPNIHRIPNTLWLEIEQEQAKATRPYLAGLFVLSAAGVAGFLMRKTGYQTPPDFVKAEAEKWAETAANNLAASMTDNTRAKLKDAVDRYITPTSTTRPPASQPIDVEFTVQPQAKAEADPAELKREYDERLEAIFGKARAERVAKTETTRAQTGGRGPVKERFETDTGDRMLGIWRHRNGLVRGKHPCPLCAPLVGTSETEWASINPDAAIGPPLHVNCDCTVEDMVISRAEFKRQVWQPPRGSELELENYTRAWKRITNSLSPRDTGVVR